MDLNDPLIAAQMCTMIGYIKDMHSDDQALFLRCIGAQPAGDDELRRDAKTITNALNTIVYASTPICEAHAGTLTGGAHFDLSAISAGIDILYEKYPWVAIMTEMLGSTASIAAAPAIDGMGRAALGSIFATLVTQRPVTMQNDPRRTVYSTEITGIVRALWMHMAALQPISSFSETTRLTDAVRDHFAPMRLRYLAPEDRSERSDAEVQAEREKAARAKHKRERRRRQAERRKQRKAEETSIREKEQAVASALAALEAAKEDLRRAEEVQKKRQEAERTECILCHDKYMDYFFVACGHGLCCDECYKETPAKEMVRYMERCAICREPNIGPVVKMRV